MKKIVRISILLVLVLISSCTHEVKSTRKFFDFQIFVDQQIKTLGSRARALDKFAQVKDQSSDTTYIPTVEGWATELELFRQLELINKPTFQSEYLVQDSVKDSKSNLKIRQYLSASAPITSLKFYYHNSFDQLKKIEAVASESNVLFASGRTLTMQFEEEDGKPLLTKYSMTGFQKMMLRDTVFFSTIGQIEQ